MTPLTAFQRLNTKAVQAGIENARKSGYTVVYTSALMDPEISGFLQCGFAVKEQLYVLKHSLEELPKSIRSTGVRLRKPTNREMSEVVKVDSKCFDNFWAMDSEGLNEAITATTRARFRVAVNHQGASGPTRILGYAITGLGDRKGYLQRLAVDPEFQGAGIAQQLVHDGFEWLRFWRAREEFVNTQISNERALGFYLKMGFHLLQERLNILQLNLSA